MCSYDRFLHYFFLFSRKLLKKSMIRFHRFRFFLNIYPNCKGALKKEKCFAVMVSILYQLYQQGAAAFRPSWNCFGNISLYSRMIREHLGCDMCHKELRFFQFSNLGFEFYLARKATQITFMYPSKRVYCYSFQDQLMA